MSDKSSRKRLLCPGELLESRLAMATAGGVERTLLPEFMAGLADPNGNQLPASDAWWALRSQRNMAIDEPISKVMNFAAHNAFNSLNEGFHILPGVAPNQILSLSGQLDVGARLIELDIHDPRPFDLSIDQTRRLILKHGPPPAQLSRSTPFYLESALLEVRRWLQRPENRNEIIFLDFEDSTEQRESTADEPLLPMLDRVLGSLIYQPAQRARDGAWPSRAQMIENQQRIVIFTHRNDGGGGRFGSPTDHFDPNGHRWFGSRLAFNTNVNGDLGNFSQVKINDFNFTTNVASENANSFFSVQGDSLRVPGSAAKYEVGDAERAAKVNVDFLKMDFLFGDDEDADLGLNVNGIDLLYDIVQGNRIAMFERAVWSWAKDDPAVDRQVFQDLTPGDGTGNAMFNLISRRLDLTTANNLAEIGAQARNNGRDVATIGDSRWHSTSPISTFGRSFAARSVLPNSLGQYEWRVTAGRSTRWLDGDQIVRAEFGSGFVFSAPINGFQNFQLDSVVGNASVWLKVHDFDRDGNWKIGDIPALITSMVVQPTSIDEGKSVQVNIQFVDELRPHGIRMDWGDGTINTASIDASSQSAILFHDYRDDGPRGLVFDNFVIKAMLFDSGRSLENPVVLDDQSAIVQVRNVTPSISAITNSASSIGNVAKDQPVSLVASFTDAGVLDTHQAQVNWGDGSPVESVIVVQGNGSGTIQTSHAYAAGGIYTITLTVTDDDAGVVSATTKAFITGVGLNSGTLYIIGSRDRDSVRIDQSGSNISIVANFEEQSRLFSVRAASQIIAYLGDGDDQLMLSSQLKLPAIVHGGRGNDKLNGGSASVLLGDEGNDELTSGFGRSVLIGGTGLDQLVAGRAGDVLIGGKTNIDQRDESLLAILIKWNSTANLESRTRTIASAIRLIEDRAIDKLTGGVSQDLFFAGLSDQLIDVARDDLVRR